MFPKQLLKDYLVFTRKDRIGAILIVAVVGGSLFLPRFLAPAPQAFFTEKDTALVPALDTLQQREVQKISTGDENRTAYQYERSSSSGYTEGELFPFDPNIITTSDWQRLGLRERTAKTILNYVSKGGRFYKPEDLQKIWGLPEGFYNRVKDYIRLPEKEKRTPFYNENSPEFTKTERRPFVVNVNEADTAALIALPGIGSKLSARIISFREKLGGFYSVEQVGETYGLPDSTFQKIKFRLQVEGTAIRKINLNTATKDELKEHPYIRWKLANVIVEYRNQHGSFKTLEELRNIVLIDETTYQKISPYLGL